MDLFARNSFLALWYARLFLYLHLSPTVNNINHRDLKHLRFFCVCKFCSVCENANLNQLNQKRRVQKIRGLPPILHSLLSACPVNCATVGTSRIAMPRTVSFAVIGAHLAGLRLPTTLSRGSFLTTLTLTASELSPPFRIVLCVVATHAVPSLCEDPALYPWICVYSFNAQMPLLRKSTRGWIETTSHQELDL